MVSMGTQILTKLSFLAMVPNFKSNIGLFHLFRISVFNLSNWKIPVWTIVSLMIFLRPKNYCSEFKLFKLFKYWTFVNPNLIFLKDGLHSRLKCLGGVPVLWSKWPLASSLLQAIKNVTKHAHLVIQCIFYKDESLKVWWVTIQNWQSY